MENMNTEELKNKIKDDIKFLAEQDVDANFFVDYENDAPKEKLYSIEMFDGVRDFLELSCDYDEEQMDFFQENAAEFLDYYFKCVENYSGLKYEENPWKNGDYYLVSNFNKQNGFADVNELENHIKEDIEDFVRKTKDDILDDVYDCDHNPVYTINASSKLYNIYHYLKTIGGYSEEDINYFENNTEKFLDYYFECVEEYTGLKYERNFWKNNVYNLVED